jgi:hypothetical protein
MAWFTKNKNQGTMQSPGKNRLTLSEIASTGGQKKIRDVSNALWYPAGQPIPSVAPKGTPPRRYAYTPLANINWSGRDGQIDHQALRNFSFYPIVRDIIETLKDLLCQVDWDFVLKPKDKSESGQATKLRAAKDPRLVELRKFFKKPDGWQTFRVWSRGLYDDMLIIDAASIWKQRDQQGKLCSLVQIDGAQVFPLIDETGQQPDASPYKNVLVQTSNIKAVGNQLKKAEGKGSPAFQLTPYGFPAQMMTSKDLSYCVYNRFTNRRYGFSKLEGCLAYVALSLGRLDFQASFYRSGNVPEGIAFLPPDVPIGKVDELNKYLDSILAGNLKNRRKIFFLPSYGTDKQPNIIFPKINDQVLKDEFDEWLARVLCHNFGISPMAFTKQINRGESGHMAAAQSEEGVAPILGWMKDILDDIIQEDLGYEDIEAKPQPKPEQDEEKLTNVMSNQLGGGLATWNEAREALGYDTIDEDWADVPLVKTAQGYVRIDGLKMDGSETTPAVPAQHTFPTQE